MLDRLKHPFLGPKTLRDKLRGQEKIIETLLSEISDSETEFKLFKFAVENKETSRSRNYSDLVALILGTFYTQHIISTPSIYYL
jgi:hypothetical protein